MGSEAGLGIHHTPIRKREYCLPPYLFAKVVELATYVKASGLPAEQSINRAALTLKLTVQVMEVPVYV